VEVHRYERSPHSGAGNCWCGWPDMWGDFPPPIHGGPSWSERASLREPEPKLSGLQRAAIAIARARDGEWGVKDAIARFRVDARS